MSDGDDWFERALQDLDADEERTDDVDERTDDGDEHSDDGDGLADDVDERPDTDETPGGAGDDDGTADGTDRQSTDDTTKRRDATSDAFGEAAQPHDDSSETFDESDTTDSPGRSPDASDVPGTRNEHEAADPFGGVAGDAGTNDPFGGGSPRTDAADFDPADFRNLDGGGDFGDEEYGFGDEEYGFGDEEYGFGDEGVGGGGGSEFDEEEFDSDIDRIDVGITGLDEMILGGVPERSLMVAIGSAGTGKTTFGLQFLTEALRNDGKAVYITLEESREAILSTAEEKGWPFREWCEADRLAVVALDPIEMANSLSSIRSDISRLVTEFGADRLVLDSVSLLEMMYDHPATRRSEVFDFARSLKQAGVTTMLTSEASDENAYTSRYGIVEYLVDAVFILQYVRPSDFRETRLAVEIQKIRDANHSRETKPYEITNGGISVYRQANIF